MVAVNTQSTRREDISLYVFGTIGAMFCTAGIGIEGVSLWYAFFLFLDKDKVLGNTGLVQCATSGGIALGTGLAIFLLGLVTHLLETKSIKSPNPGENPIATPLLHDGGSGLGYGAILAGSGLGFYAVAKNFRADVALTKGLEISGIILAVAIGLMVLGAAIDLVKQPRSQSNDAEVAILPPAQPL